jgi:pimeloyl-ACP methyl ester carboxylesterase
MTMTSIARRTGSTSLAGILTVTVLACSQAAPGPTNPPSSTAPTASQSATIASASATAASPTAEALPRIELPVEPGSEVEGLLDIDGHDIYARCAGEGAPTVVYFTGWAGDPGDPPKLAVSIARGIEAALGDDVRVCSYDRRNIGRSEIVDGTQTPEDTIADIDGVLEALGEEGPFVLVGASFGGLVSSAYAVAHPDRVAGVLLLDSSTAVDYELEEKAGLQGMCLPANREFDGQRSLERIDNCSLAKWIHDRRDLEPEVPLLFLAAAGAPERGSPNDAVVKSWAESWSPGEFRVVNEPHWMDEANPGLVADAIREVIALGR